jgi:segregation and condensation protein B
MSNEPISLPWLITDERTGSAASGPEAGAAGAAEPGSATPPDPAESPDPADPAESPEGSGLSEAGQPSHDRDRFSAILGGQSVTIMDSAAGEEPEPASGEAEGAEAETAQAPDEAEQAEAEQAEAEQAEAEQAEQAEQAEAAGAGEAAGAAEAGAGPGLRASLEAILLVADEPVPENVIAQVVERPTEEVAAALRALAGAYTAEERGFDLREIAGGWRFYTRADCAGVVERFVRDGQEVRLTQAALETLAVVAYRQPVSRARVSAVRGVNCDGVMRTLVLRGLVEESGTDPDTGAIQFQTTGYFLERLGLASLADLPELAPFLPDHLDDEQDAGHENTGS